MFVPWTKEKSLGDRFDVVSTLWHFDDVTFSLQWNECIPQFRLWTCKYHTSVRIREHIECLLANHSARPLKQHEMCEAVTHTFSPDNNTCNVHMQKMREKERKSLWLFLVYLFLLSLHDCNVWIELNWANWASELWQCHATICSTTRTHTPNVDPKDVTFDFKSSNPWISYSVCSMACCCCTNECTVSSFNRFQSFSIRCHANLLRKKTLSAQCQWHSIQFTKTLFRACIFQKEFDFVFLFAGMRWAWAYN